MIGGDTHTYMVGGDTHTYMGRGDRYTHLHVRCRDTLLRKQRRLVTVKAWIKEPRLQRSFQRVYCSKARSPCA